MILFLLLQKVFCPIYVRFVLLYWKHSSFENISLFQEANILLLSENMNLYLLLDRERRLLSHLCQICLALLKIQQFWKYHAISGGKYPNAHRKHELIFIIRKGFCPNYVGFALLNWKYSSFENITLFQEANILLFQNTWTYLYYYKKSFVPFKSDLSCFTASTAVLKISRYFKRQISYCF